MKNNEDRAHRIIRTSAAVFLIAGIATGVARLTEPAEPAKSAKPRKQRITYTAVPLTEKPPIAVTAAVVFKTYYDVPLALELQDHITALCDEAGIDPAVVLAIIYKESGYKADAKGDHGSSLGLMQIQGRWVKDLMAELGVTDLLDPYGNVTVGVRILKDHLDRYDRNMSMALMAYNAGAAGARKNWFSKGVYSNAYSRSVLAHADKIRESAYETISER